MKMILKIFAAVGIFFAAADAYSKGGDCSRIDSMIPGHGQQGNGNSPYNIRIVKRGGVAATSIAPGETVGIEIMATAPLRGLALQARDERGIRVGEFPISNEDQAYCLQHHCSGDKTAVTHNNIYCRSRTGCSVQEPCRIIILWIGPQEATGTIHFRLTGVLEYNTWYQVQSAPTLFQAATSSPSPQQQQNINNVQRSRNEIPFQPQVQQSQAPPQNFPLQTGGSPLQSLPPKQCQGPDEFPEWCQSVCHVNKCSFCCNEWDTCKSHCKTTCC